MKRVTVAPGLVLDDEMFGRALIALGIYAPDEVTKFTWEQFTSRTRWRLIPDVENPEVPFFKAELVVKLRPPYEQTVKLNLWHSADLRRDGAPLPHNHPWAFASHVLMGGYREDRYAVGINQDGIFDDPYSKWSVGDTQLTQGVTHEAGNRNEIGLTTFHEVVEVLEPDRTLTLMNCGPGRKDGWGYLEDNGNGELAYIPNKLSPVDGRFKALLLDRNPHLRK